MKDFLLFSGSSNIPLAHEVAKILGVTLGTVDLSRFADGELRPWIQEDVRDKTVFVLESLSHSMDEHIMEIALMGDAIRRSAPKNMIAVIPYMGYARQDKQHRIGEPISARVIAKFLEVSKYKEIIALDLHNDAIVGFFQIPVLHLNALSILQEEVLKMNLSDPVVISPDVGGVKRARNLAYQLDVPLVVMEKKRFLDKHDTSETFEIIGNVQGKSAVIIDDVISTGQTIVHSAESLMEAGAKKVIVIASHGIFAGSACENLDAAPIESIIVTNSINHMGHPTPKKMKEISIAHLISQAITTVVR